MERKKIFGYVDQRVFDFLEETKAELRLKGHTRKTPSKSRIIELALLELESKNDFDSIERKLLYYGLL